MLMMWPNLVARIPGNSALGELQRRTHIQVQDRSEHRWVDGVNSLMPGEPHIVDDTQHLAVIG
jgi:hypothetical protein